MMQTASVEMGNVGRGPECISTAEDLSLCGQDAFPDSYIVLRVDMSDENARKNLSRIARLHGVKFTAIGERRKKGKVGSAFGSYAFLPATIDENEFRQILDSEGVFGFLCLADHAKTRKPKLLSSEEVERLTVLNATGTLEDRIGLMFHMAKWHRSAQMALLEEPEKKKKKKKRGMKRAGRKFISMKATKEEMLTRALRRVG